MTIKLAYEVAYKFGMPEDTGENPVYYIKNLLDRKSYQIDVLTDALKEYSAGATKPAIAKEALIKAQ